jgi:hypothetical protein
VCFDLDVIGLDAEPIALLTPRSVHLRVSAPATFTEVSQDASGNGPGGGGTIEGRVQQTTPTEAEVTFDKELVPTKLLPDGLVEIGVQYQGKSYAFAFGVKPSMTLDSARMHDGVIALKVNARERGKLAVTVKTGKKATVWTTRIKRAPETITIRHRLRASVRSHKHCRVRVTLSNQAGKVSVGSDVAGD